MKIGIDCRTILNPARGEAGGIGHYVYQLVRHLLKIDHENEYVLLFDERIKRKKIKKFSQKNVKIIFHPFFLYYKFVPIKFAYRLYDATIEKEKLDILHLPRVSSFPRKINVKTILTIHDLSFLKIPLCFSKKECEKEKERLSSTLPNVEMIIAVSQSTKDDLVNNFEFPAEKIKVIYHGLDERFFKQASPEEIEKVKKKYKIKNNYIFFLSPLEIRKNVCRLITAFDYLREIIKNEPQKFSSVFEDKNIQLVLSGKPGSGLKIIKETIKKSPYKKDIILTNYVPPEDLNPLFDGAKVFAFPSLYEGFGLPVIEAMAGRIPIVTSNLSSLPEIIGEDNAIFVNPYNDKEIARALVEVLTNKELREKIIANASKRVKEFTWQRTAQETIKVYQEVAQINL